ncbi:MAG: type II toxin-antitoxin system PemK/MazF family toxin [Actinobacteria bacterium]|nr:type II toxin-antitoxin system PemK/MazF family toxin [Actinomycetota bacterium]
MVVAQGDIFWASLPDPVGSGPGFARPVVIVQGDALNASRLATVVVVPLTSNLRWASAPGNVLLKRRRTGLAEDSVANVSQIVAVDRDVFSEHAGRLSRAQLELILGGIDVVLGRAG